MINISECLFILKGIVNDLYHEKTDSIFDIKNIQMVSELSDYILNKSELNEYDKSILERLIEIGNITYNNMDTDILPIEDGVYDLLLEKLKRYNPNYQIGAKPVFFNNTNGEVDMSLSDKKPVIRFITEEEQKKINDMLYPEIIKREKKFTQRDLMFKPIDFFGDTYITKRLRNTAHEHPELVGTLDKCKYVTDREAIEKGVYDDSNVKILERDFFAPLIEKGIIDTRDGYTMILELKYDGVSIEADIENGMIVSARTRGDTNESVASDITPILGGYVFPDAYDLGIEPLGMKFEAIMTNQAIEELCALKNVNYKNGRTAIIGLLGSSDAYRYRELITLIPLATTLKDENGEPIDRLVEIEFMNRYFCRSELLRFSVINGNFFNLMYQIKKFVNEAEFSRDYLPFMYDGVVLSFYNPELRKRLGRVNSVNKYQVAIKFNALKKTTMFLGYTFEVGKNGVITPMIHYQPVEFFGTRHPKSSGHSYQRFMELQLKEGDIISVEYVNDVMPYVYPLDIERNRKNTNPIVPFPTHCPICGTEILISESNRSAYCPNMRCEGRLFKKMEDTMSKLGIVDFAYESIRALGITSFHQLMKAVDENPCRFNLLGPNDSKHLIDQLVELKQKHIPDYKYIGSLGFSNIAIKTFKLIFSKYYLKEFMDKYYSSKESLREDMLNIKGIGAKTIDTIFDELPYYKDDIQYIMRHCNVIQHDVYGKEENKPKIVFTGFRDKELSEKLNALGFDANPNNTLTKETYILVIPVKNHQSAKVRKAISYGINVMTPEELEYMLEGKKVSNKYGQDL